MDVDIRVEKAGEEMMRAVIRGALTIYQAARAKEILLSALGEAQGELEVDLGEVSEIDTAGVQILVMLKTAASDRKRSLRIVHGGPSLQVIERYKLATFFGDPVVLPPERATQD